MAFAQKNYSQTLGTGPEAVSIADAGCFLTAFSNLLERYGETIDPPTLNAFFIQHGTYINETGARDLLAWGSVSAYDGQVGLVSSGTTGWPNSNDAIVKFIYRNSKGGTVTHFCLVADAGAQTIVDSWDGVTKKSPYGQPVEWHTYARHTAQTVVTVPVNTPPAAAAFTIENIPARNEELKIDTHLWDLNRRSWPDMANNPVGNAAAGTKFETSQIAHHILGGSYYLPAGSTTQGYNIVDCEDAPAAPAAPAHPYTVETITPKQMSGDQVRTKWNLDDTSWPAFQTNPVGTLPAGQPITVVAIAHHNLGGSYYMEDANVAAGYNTVDLHDYTAPAAAPAAPTSYTTNIVDGITFDAYDGDPKRMYISKPEGAEKWSFKDVDTWRGFKSVQHVDYGSEVFIAGEAHHPIPPNGATYLMTADDFGNFKKTGNVANFYGFNRVDLSDTKPPALATPAPAKPVVSAPAAPVTPAKPAATVSTTAASTTPVDWKDTFVGFVQPVKYIATRDMTVQDLDGKQPNAPLKKYDPAVSDKDGVVTAYGTVTKDGIEYYKLHTANDPTFSFWYCIPKIDPETRTPNLLVKPVSATDPVSVGTLVADAAHLTKSKIITDAGELFDDILPKFLKKKKK